MIKEVGAYSERQYQRQDGTTEYFKSRGVVLKHGGDEVYGEMTGDYASKNRDTQYYQNQPYVGRGTGSIARGRTRTARYDTRMHSILLICRVFNDHELH